MNKVAVVVPSVLVMSLIGCGGSGGGETPKDSHIYQEQLNGFNDDKVTSWLDIELKTRHKVQDIIDKAQLVATFDINNSGVFDEGDIRITAGNASGFATYESKWHSGSDYVIEAIIEGELHKIRERSGIIVQNGIKHIFVNDIGGVWIFNKTVDGKQTESAIGLKTNKAMTGESSDSAQIVKLISYINNVSPSTPINIILRDGLENESADYVPAYEVFSQQQGGKVSDPAADFTGFQNWVDITSVTFSHGSR